MHTPDNINKLEDNQIFVFGSNLNGAHGRGAAKMARDLFGAKIGIGEGLTGKTYAFPTLDKEMKQASHESLIKSKEKLYNFAEENPELKFFVTKVGCGLAGFTEEYMKSIFIGAKPENIILPIGW
jgi:hypothetical protein